MKLAAVQAVALYTARETRLFLDDTFDFGRSSDGARATRVVASRAKVPETHVRAAARILMGELFRLAGVRACSFCGCTDDEACPGGCRWVARPRINAQGEIEGDNLCSSCGVAPARRKAVL